MKDKLFKLHSLRIVDITLIKNIFENKLSFNKQTLVNTFESSFTHQIFSILRKKLFNLDVSIKFRINIFVISN